MTERESTTRTVIVTYFPMFIAVLSLVTSIFNGYLNARFVELIERNLGRSEYLRTCKELLEAHAQIRLRARLVGQIAERKGDSSEVAAAQTEADIALIRFTSLATYLANLQTEARERYTQLALELDKIVTGAARLAPADLMKRFEKTDQMFTSMNDDCVRMASSR